MAADEQWRALDLDTSTLDRVPPAKLLELLADVSPDVSRALWDFLRFCNPGWTATAMRLNGKTAAPAAAQAALDAFLAALKQRHGSVDVVIGRTWIGAFMRGAFLAELILDKAGRNPLDVATPDPASVRYIQVPDSELGTVWQLGQWQNGKWVALDYATIRYVPIDPFPGSPYGRSLAAPALFPALFLVALLHDLRRVVAQQGYPRLDLEILIDKIKDAMPDDAEEDPEAFKQWVDEATAAVQAAYEKLEPDDAFVHPDWVKVNRPVGAVDSSSLGAVDGLIRALERQVVRALKTMPLLMGLNEGSTETHANRQWEVHAAGIKALQHLCESLLEHLLTIAMQAQGIAAVVQFRFAELRSAEKLKDAQTQEKTFQNAAFAYDRGWISQDEASQMAVGKNADAPTPRSSGKAAASSDTTPTEADPGSNR